MTDNQTVIRVAYSLWLGKEGTKLVWKGCDVFYKIDSKTGKASRMFDSVAHELICTGKAVLQLDYDSIGKIEFILTDDSSAKTFLLTKKGERRSIAFKDALRIIADGMACIYDIKIE